MNRRLRQTIVAATAGAVAVSLSVVAVSLAGNSVPPVASGREGPPGALGAHLEQVKRAAPGGVEVEEGPGAAAQAEFQKRAYPADTISVDKAQAAMQGYRQVEALTARISAGQGDRTTAQQRVAGRWRNVGPSRALYPFTRFRNVFNYVPNKYVAGGRTTDVAVADTCVRGDCRMYITPAGGGVC